MENQLPYLIAPTRDSVLVLGSGGGSDVWNALRGKASLVDAVEINPTTFRLMREKYRDVSNGLFWRPGVHTWKEEGRSFVRRTNRRYDLIMIHGIDTFAALNSGAYMLSENYLYTVDALIDYWNRLKDGGMLCINRWYHPGESVRLFTTGLEALQRLGIRDPGRHLVLVAGTWTGLLIRKTPFSWEDYQRIQKQVLRHNKVMGFPVPSVQDLPPLQRTLLNYSTFCDSGRQEIFFQAYPYDVRPVYDDNPFFFNYEKWGHLLIGFSRGGDWNWIRGHWPTLTLWSLFLLSFLAVILFMWLPMLLKGRKAPDLSPGARKWLLYFACLGVSFIFVEIALMQRFALLLGHPMRSLALVLATLLIGCGIGSWFGPKLGIRLEVKLILLSLLILATAFLYPVIVSAALPWPLWARGLTTVLLVLPLAFLMGIPFPSGIQEVSRGKAEWVPWMWGVNGGATVLGSIGAIILAIGSSFTAVLLSASAGYLFACLLILRLGKAEPASG